MAPFLAQADATIVNVATPAIRSDLGASGATLQLVVGGYMITFAVLIITGARLGQTHGYKRMFMLGVAVFGSSSLLGGLAPDVGVLIVARVLQGAASALMFPQTLTGIQLNLSGARQVRAIGQYAIALSSGAVLGQVLGGLLVSADVAGTGWRPILLVNVPVCVVALAAASRLLPRDHERGTSNVDVRGIAMLSVAVLLVVVPLTLGRDVGWPAWTWMCLAASGPAGWVFLRAERRLAAAGHNPLVNVDVVRGRPVLLGLLAAAGATGTYYALLFTLAQYFQQGLGRSALASGLILVPWVAAFGVAGQITRRLPTRFVAILPSAGYLLLAAAYLALGAALSAGRPDDGLLAVLLALGGLGLGTGFTTLIGHLTSAVPGRYAPDISGVSTTTMQIGGAVGVAAFGSLYLSLASATESHARHAFAGTTLALGAAALIATVVAFLATRTGRPAADHAPAPVPVLAVRHRIERFC
jgi:hypothetical protein